MAKHNEGHVDTRRMIEKKRVQVPMIVILTLFVVFSLQSVMYWSVRVATDDAFIEGPASAVSPKASGHILDVFADDNQAVKAGEVLAQIDPRDYEARVKEARAVCAMAQAQAENAHADAQRYAALQVNDEISRSELGRVQTADKAATAAYEKAKAVLEQAELALSYTKIVAPVDGRVTEMSLEKGVFVQVGQNVLTVVGPARWVIANFKETDVDKLKPGQAVTIKVDAYAHMALKGHVDSIQRGTGSRFSLLPAENATGNYIKVVQRVPVKIVIDDPIDEDTPLALGMSVVPVVKTK